MRCGCDAKYIALRAANDLIHPELLTDEAVRFTLGVRVILETWGSEDPLRVPNQYVWLLKARKEVYKTAELTPLAVQFSGPRATAERGAASADSI